MRVAFWPLFNILYAYLSKKKIKQMQRDFLWLGVGEYKRDHFISWDLVCKSKVERGLRFGEIFTMNCALLGK